VGRQDLKQVAILGDCPARDDDPVPLQHFDHLLVAQRLFGVLVVNGQAYFLQEL
jgi:hypothetical protein